MDEVMEIEGEAPLCDVCHAPAQEMYRTVLELWQAGEHLPVCVECSRAVLGAKIREAALKAGFRTGV